MPGAFDISSECEDDPLRTAEEIERCGAEGAHRRVHVVNRKGTAAPPESILTSVHVACGNWTWRREHAWPDDEEDQVRFVVAEANSLTVAVYDVHPFIDGNTRATWHLRNYMLMADGLLPLVDLDDQQRYEDAWWSATPDEHRDLDECVLHELGLQESRK